MRRARSRLLTTAVSERNGILLIVSLSFLVGCLAALRLTGGLWLWISWGVPASGMDSAQVGRGRGHCARALLFRPGRAALPVRLWDAPAGPGTYEITGYVYGGASERPDQRVAFVLGDIALDGVPAYGTAYCTLHYDDVPPELFDGAQVRLEGRVYLPDGKSGEPHRDFALWMRQSGQSFGIAAYQGIEVLNARRMHRQGCGLPCAPGFHPLAGARHGRGSARRRGTAAGRARGPEPAGARGV